MLLLIGSGFLAQNIVAVVGGADKVGWITLVIGFFSTALGPPAAQFADYWGRKWFLVGGMLSGFAGCLLVGRANSWGMVIAGQCVSGIGQMSVGLLHTVMSEILPRKYRPVAQSTIHMTGSLAAAVAFYAGGAMCEHSPAGFRAYFYMTSAIFFVVSVGITLLYHPPARPLQHISTKERLRSLDVVGYLLLIVGLVGICVALAWSQNPYGWKNAHVLATFLVGIAGIIGLAIYAIFINKQGLIHHGLFRHGPNFAIAVTCTVLEGIIFFAPLNYFGYELAVLFQMNFLDIAYCFSISWWLYGLAAVVTGIYCSRTKTLRLPICLAFLSGVIYFVLMATVKTSWPKAVWGYGVFFGVFLGTALNGLVVVAQLSTPPDLIATATCLIIALRGTGASVGVAIYTAIFDAALSPLHGTKPPTQLEVVQLYEVAFRNIWIAAGACAFVAMCCMSHTRLLPSVASRVTD